MNKNQIPYSIPCKTSPNFYIISSMFYCWYNACSLKSFFGCTLHHNLSISSKQVKFRFIGSQNTFPEVHVLVVIHFDVVSKFDSACLVHVWSFASNTSIKSNFVKTMPNCLIRYHYVKLLCNFLSYRWCLFSSIYCNFALNSLINMFCCFSFSTTAENICNAFGSFLFGSHRMDSTGVPKIIESSVPDRRKYIFYFQNTSACIVYMFDR